MVRGWSVVVVTTTLLTQSVESLQISRRRNGGKLWERMFTRKGRKINDAFLQVEMERLSNDSHCTDAPEVTKDACMAKDKCMWLSLESKNVCLPCSLGADTPLPCPPVDSVFATQKVKDCQMTCAHQFVITKSSVCTDVSDFSVTKNQCMAKGEASVQKCMWTSYVTADGATKNVCGPCEVAGVGQIPCYAPGNSGPEPGSEVAGCASACEEQYSDFGIPCGDGASVTPCRPTAPPVLPIEVTTLEKYGAKMVDGAPEYFAADVAPPFDKAAFKAAAAAAAGAAGWTPDTPLPPTAPVVVWGAPPVGAPPLPKGTAGMWGPAPPGVEGGLPDPGLEPGTLPRTPIVVR